MGKGVCPEGGGQGNGKGFYRRKSDGSRGIFRKGAESVHYPAEHNMPSACECKYTAYLLWFTADMVTACCGLLLQGRGPYSQLLLLRVAQWVGRVGWGGVPDSRHLSIPWVAIM
jgi:hypothetical protein